MNPSVRFPVFLLVHFLFTAGSGLCAIGKTSSQLSEGMLPFYQIYPHEVNQAGAPIHARRRNEIAPTAYRTIMVGMSEYNQWCKPGPDGLNI